MEEKKGEVLVHVEGVSKKYSRNLKSSMRYGMTELLSTIVGIQTKRDKLKKDEFWAVQDISFELRRGECIGLIGRNGAGKSTLLKVLNGLIRPDKGSIRIRGKIGALIELGAGFNPLLTGRENIHVNGQLLGFSRAQIEEKMQAILDFAEINEFIDSPVQNYSSGMKVRLGFAIAVQMEPDVLIIDEVLAVGDLGFILKCFNRMDTLLKNTAVIFVSHSMPQVSRVCTHIIVMEGGRAIFQGDSISEGIDVYYSKFAQTQGLKVVFDRNGDAELINILFGQETQTTGELFTINRLENLDFNIEFRIRENIPCPFVVLSIMDKEQRPIGICQSEKGTSDSNKIKTVDGYAYYRIKATIPRINLSKGIYSVAFSITEDFRSEPVLRINSARNFQVFSTHDVWPPIEFESHWE